MDSLVKVLFLLLVGALIGYWLGWGHAHITVANERKKLGAFYVGKSVFHCTEAASHTKDYPDLIRDALHDNAFPHTNAKVWIEAGNYSDRGAELRIAFKEALPNGFADFWIPVSQPNGDALGWLQFSYIASVFTESIFAATGWRPAHDPAPSEQSVLPLPLTYVPEGFAPPL